MHEALADAGCTVIEAVPLGELAREDADVIVLELAGGDLAGLPALVAAQRAPILVLCEDHHIEAAHAAGAAASVGFPVRSGELVGRIRCMLRDRDQHAQRERRTSERLASLQREKDALERLVCVDALTGIANRRHALSLLRAEWRRASRDHLPLGVVMIDLDCYHAYNEQYGHLGGDACLQHVCEAMVTCLRRPSDFLGRYGGEEFLAVLPNTDAVGAKLVAERLRACVEALAIPHVASACARVVTITAGFASLHVAPDLTMDRLIAVADAALLRAKSQGRNRVEGDAPLVRQARVSARPWERFAPVLADPWFADRIPGFLADVHAAARAIVNAIGNDDPTRIVQRAATLRTTAKNLDLPVVDQLVDDLARAALADEAEAARAAANELVQYVTHVQVIYRREGEPVGMPAEA